MAAAPLYPIWLHLDLSWSDEFGARQCSRVRILRIFQISKKMTFGFILKWCFNQCSRGRILRLKNPKNMTFYVFWVAAHVFSNSGALRACATAKRLTLWTQTQLVVWNVVVAYNSMTHLLNIINFCQFDQRLYDNKKLCYCRETARCAVLVNSCYMFQEVWELERFQTANMTFKVIEGHWQWCTSTGHIWFPISIPLQLCLYFLPLTRHYHLCSGECVCTLRTEKRHLSLCRSIDTNISDNNMEDHYL